MHAGCTKKRVNSTLFSPIIRRFVVWPGVLDISKTFFLPFWHQLSWLDHYLFLCTSFCFFLPWLTLNLESSDPWFSSFYATGPNSLELNKMGDGVTFRETGGGGDSHTYTHEAWGHPWFNIPFNFDFNVDFYKCVVNKCQVASTQWYFFYFLELNYSLLVGHNASWRA